MNILLLGATGRVGSKILAQSLSDGHRVTVLVREPDKLTISSDNMRVIKSDVRSVPHVHLAAQDAEAIISCLSTDGTDVLSSSMPIIIQAMIVSGIHRIIIVSTAGILQSRFHPDLLRYESGESRRGMTRAVLEHRKAWELLADTQLDWTIVCPTYLPAGESLGVYRVETDVLPLDGTNISVDDTANFTYQQLFSTSYYKKRVGIAY